MASFNRREFLTSLAAGFAGITCLDKLPVFAQPIGKKGKKPNVLFILIDDMGWMDNSLYGSKYYETPNLERLAKRGMMFTQAYSANPLCSPTRLSLMCGKYPGRLNIWTAVCAAKPDDHHVDIDKTAPAWQPYILPNCRLFMPETEYTIAEALRDNGYRTGFFGKWHLGGAAPYWPDNQGFDVNKGGAEYPCPSSYFSPYNNRYLPDGPKGEYITDRLTDETIKFIKDCKQGDKPFFACLWHYSVHAPFQAKAEVIEKYKNKKDPRGVQLCPELAAMVESTDESLGRIMDTLDELGITNDTILVFFSDNGGPSYWYDTHGNPDTSNLPLRSSKGTLYEGGTRVPCVISWPGVTRPNSVSDAVFSSIDFYPTFLEITGLAHSPKQQLDGASIVPLLKGAKKYAREEIFCYFPFLGEDGLLNAPGVYVRKGDWKLIKFYFTTDEYPNLYELYNLREDLGETTNLADKYPTKVKELDALIERHLKETGAITPIKNPNYDPHAFKEAQGWFGIGDGLITQASGTAVVTCQGGDNPGMKTRFEPLPSGEYTLAMRARNDMPGGKWKVFYGDDNLTEVTQPFKVGQGWQDIAVKISSKEKLGTLAIYSGSGKGRVRYDWIEIKQSSGGGYVKRWDF